MWAWPSFASATGGCALAFMLMPLCTHATLANSSAGTPLSSSAARKCSISAELP
jgi:hypothetical protein